MAGRGPASTGKAQRRNKQPPSLVVSQDGEVRGFDLPLGVITDKKGLPVDWHPMTVSWWEAWRRSPQAVQMMTEPDWYMLLDTALMHHQMWESGRWDFAAEIRLRVGKFGASPEDRMRLRMEVEIPEQHPVGNGKGASVTSISSRKIRAKASGE